MRLLTVLASTILVTLSVAAQADWVPPVQGNDTGGIMSWSPETHHFRHRIAADYCARWSKIHRITSVAPRYGNYIGFACYWPRGTNGIIVRSGY
jgi:hypothetical protein